MEVATAERAPVSIAFDVEDPRQHHWVLKPLPVAPDAVGKTIAGYPDVTFVLERASLKQVREVAAAAGAASNWMVETGGRFLCPTPPGAPEDYPVQGLPAVIDLLGADRVLFGTDMPLQYPRVAIMQLRSLDLAHDVLARIMGGNAGRLLGL
jgi:predicted TIM-barrel fold metal-dependent hydrolase